LYKAGVERRVPALPELTVDFSEYAAWHKAHLRDGQFAAAVAYWRKQLAGAPTGLALAASDMSSSDGLENIHFAIDDATTLLLRSTCRTHRVTPFMALVAAFQFRLAHLSRKDDVAIYTLLANRIYPGSENLVGPFMNPTVIRSRVGLAVTFGDLLRETRDVLVAGLHYQDVPYWQLRLKVPELDRIHNAPLPQAVFNLSQGPLSMDLAPHVACTNIRLPGRRMRTGLRLDVAEAAGGLAGHLQFKPGIFAQATVATIARQLRRTLEVVARDPEIALSRLGAP
jgi:non-ribosomal peptide synthetase component F